MVKKPSVLSEFKKFVSRGNVIDLAVGIIIGAAFTSIVNSLVKDLILPPIGLIVGRMNFTDLRIVIQKLSIAPDGTTIPEVAINYGNFIQALLNFFIISFVVFLLVKMINKIQKKDEAEKSKSKDKETELSVLKDIRKELKKR